MTNLCLSLRKIFSRHSGGATFLTAVILLVVSSMIILFAANISKKSDKLISNQVRSEEAFQAAEAGLEFGISYLRQHAATVVASPTSGHITFSNGSTTNVALPNGSQFSVVYTNPITNNYDLITITSTGTNADGSATRTIQQQIQAASILSNYGTSPLVTKGDVNISGNGTIVNTNNDQTVQAGGNVTFGGNGSTVINTGVGSNASGTGGDVQGNESSLANMSQSDFFATYFGTSNMDTIKAQAGDYYSNSSNTNYSTSLNGKTGSLIWIDQTGGSTASVSGNTTIGSAANPVIMVVNGQFSISGNVTIYGFIYIVGSSGIDTLTGNIVIHGGVASVNNINMGGNSEITYDTTILNNLMTQSNLRYYAKVAGSWKDF